MADGEWHISFFPVTHNHIFNSLQTSFSSVMICPINTICGAAVPPPPGNVIFTVKTHNFHNSIDWHAFASAINLCLYDIVFKLCTVFYHTCIMSCMSRWKITKHSKIGKMTHAYNKKRDTFNHFE